MADNLQGLGTAALQKAPQPLRRALGGLGVQFKQSAPDEYHADGNYDSSNIAGVPIGDPRSVHVMAPAAFAQPQNTPQLATHEGTHIWQNNLPPSIQNAIPADNPADPYNYGGTSAVKRLLSQGKGLVNMPREQAAAAMQYGQSQGMPEPYNRLAQTMNNVPLSQIEMTDPNAKTLNMRPRTPQAPPSTVPGMNYAQQTYKKGDPAPGDDGIDLSAGLEDHKPQGDGIDLSAGFDIPENSVTQTGPKTFSGPKVEMPYSFKSLALVGGDIAKGAAKGAANTLFNVGANTPMPSYLSGSGYTNHENVGPKPGALNPQGLAQNLGYGSEQAAEFFAPSGVEGRIAGAATDAAPFLGKTIPKIGAQALTSGAMNAAQGGDFNTGAIVGGIGGAAGRFAEAVAPTVAETALGVRNVDRTGSRTPGQAILQDTTGVRPRTVADSAQAAANNYTGQLDNAISNADQRFIQQPRIAGMLPAPKVEVPLGSSPVAPDMPGGLFDAQRFPAQNVGEARVIRRPNGQIMPKADRNVEFPDASGKLPPGRGNGGQFLTQQPSRKAFMTGAEDEVGATPEFSGPGVLLRDQEFGPYSGPPIRPNLTPDAPTLTPARNIIGDAQQRSLPMKNALQPAADTLATDFRTGQAYPDTVLPSEVRSLKQQLSDLKKRWPIEDKSLGGDTIGGAYGALDSELERTVPGSQQLNQKISSLIPVADRANAADLNANLLQRSLARFGKHTGAATMAGLGSALGYREGGTKGAIEGGVLGLAGPEFLANPTTLMVGARSLNTLGGPIARYMGGAAAQLFRPQSKQ